MYKCGDKFTFKNMIIDIEVNGFTPMAQGNTGENMYSILLNGLPMKIAQSFLDQLVAQDNQNKKSVEEQFLSKNKTKGVKKNARK